MINVVKIKYVVIDRVVQENLNLRKTLKGNGYMQDERRIYHNGKKLFFTREDDRYTICNYY
ncbi:hypothetical protein SOASR031_34780 [Leminorella grimontii]|nr:hypothetical protein SOASR031_34780 [Leminorella grimontii]